MANADPYGVTDRLDENSIAAIIARLEARGRDPFFLRMLDEYLDALRPADLGRVLEVGCGTGVVARRLAARPEFGGHVDASDLSPDLIAAARSFAEEEGAAGRISFSAGDALALAGQRPYQTVIAHTVISHVADFRGFLAAMRRAVAPDGWVVIFDGDYASITFGAADPADGAAFADATIRGIITNPAIMRQMPHLAAEAGFEVERSFAYLLSEIGAMTFFASLLPTLRVLLPKAGVADEATVNGWVEQQQAYSEAGRFFGAINFYTFMLKPVTD